MAGPRITVAPTGAETAKADWPQLPTELVAVAGAGRRAGLVLADRGSTNFGDDVFLNPFGFMSALYVQAQERQVVPEFAADLAAILQRPPLTCAKARSLLAVRADPRPGAERRSQA